MQKTRLFEQAFVQLAGLGELFGGVSGIVTGKNAFANDIEKQGVESLERSGSLMKLPSST